MRLHGGYFKKVSKYIFKYKNTVNRNKYLQL